MAAEVTGSTMDCNEVIDRLPWWLNGTLSVDERAVVSFHLETCDRCLGEFQRTRAAAALHAHHVPTQVLVDYGLGHQDVDFDRAALEAHLVHCEDCADELRLVQQDGAADQAPDWMPPGVITMRSAGASGLGWGVSGFALGLVAALVLFGVWSVVRSSLVGSALPGPGSRAATQVALVEVLPESLAVRGSSTQAVATKPGPVVLVLVSDRAEAFEDVRLLALSEDGELAWETEGLERSEDGAYSILLPQESLEPGPLVLRLEGRQNEAWSEIERYRLEVRSRGGPG